MKQLLFFTFLSLGISLQAQITVTDAIFPQAGDVLTTSTTTDFNTAVTVTAPSATAQSWDFSMLTANGSNTDTIKAASTGVAFGQFPTTEILRPLLGFGTSYVDVSSSAMTIEGAGLELFGLSFIAPFSDPAVIQTASLTYGTNNTDNYALTFSSHIDSVPFLRQFIDSLNPLPVSPDSIRLRLTGNSIHNVDAFGTCTAPDSTYDVLRQKVTTYTYIAIDLHTTTILFGPQWTDVTSLIANASPIPLNDTTIYYDFIAEGIKEPIVRINRNNADSEITSIDFRGENLPTAITNIAKEWSKMEVFPNPATDIVELRLVDFENTTFNAFLVDVNGRVLLEKSALVGNQHQIEIDQLPTGVYQLLLTDKQGVLIGRKAVVVK